MGIRQRRTAETKALLLEAGLSVFAERGVEFATLDDIAQTAGFTKGAIYRQFPSKGAFLLALFEQYAAVAGSGPSSCGAPRRPVPARSSSPLLLGDTWCPRTSPRRSGRLATGSPPKAFASLPICSRPGR